MKKIIAMTSLLLIGCAAFTAIPIEERKSEIVIEDLNKGKDELYDITLEWMAKVFKDSKSVIEVKDKNRGKIIGKGYWVVTGFGNTGVTFTLSISIKESKIRGQFENYGYYDGSPIYTSDKWVLEKSKQKAIEKMDDLKKYINEYGADEKW